MYLDDTSGSNNSNSKTDWATMVPSIGLLYSKSNKTITSVSVLYTNRTVGGIGLAAEALLYLIWMIPATATA